MLRSNLLFTIALLGLAAAAPAQSGIGDALIFTGLTATSGAETYAWLSWNPTDPGVLNGRVVAVYRKSGNAASAAPFAGTAEGSLAGWIHIAANPISGTNTNVTGVFTPPADAREFHIYRRVNDSAPSLITQGATTTPTTTWIDSAPLANSATLEYFLQTYDASSNASPLVTQGAPLTVIPLSLPTPMLEPLVSVLPLTNARLRVKWLCSTAGAERFEIWFARASGNAATSTGSGLSADLATHPNMDTSLAETARLDFAVFQTGLTRMLTVGGTPEFEALLPVSASDTYTVIVRAVGVGEYSARAVSPFSNVETSTYSIRALAVNLPIPWPDRALPPRSPPRSRRARARCFRCSRATSPAPRASRS